MTCTICYYNHPVTFDLPDPVKISADNVLRFEYGEIFGEYIIQVGWRWKYSLLDPSGITDTVCYCLFLLKDQFMLFPEFFLSPDILNGSGNMVRTWSNFI